MSRKFPQEVITGWWICQGSVKHWPSDADVEFRVAQELGRYRVFACGTWWRWFPARDVQARYHWRRLNWRGEPW